MLVKRTRELQDKEDGNIVFSGQTKAMEEKYQDVSQEKVVTNEGYVTQPPLRARNSSWKGKNLFWCVFWRLVSLGNKVSVFLT